MLFPSFRMKNRIKNFHLAPRTPFFLSRPLNKALKSHRKARYGKVCCSFCCRLPLHLPQRNSARCCFSEAFWLAIYYAPNKNITFGFSQIIFIWRLKNDQSYLFAFFWVLLLYKRIIRDLWRTARNVDKQIIYIKCLKPIWNLHLSCCVC